MDEIITRFPPEPNGYLHLGHLKAMTYDFNKHPNCKCILRLDDTNPESEKQEFKDSIIEDVLWLGFTPWKITHTSDYFEQLYNFAIDLIKMDKAYVDFSSPDEIKSMRHDGIESIYRSKTIEWNLEEFKKMSDGHYSENTAVLRLKIDMKNTNHTLRDPIAYRIKFAPHYRTGEKYKIYPSYDYSHGIIDSLENITYSYCTMEFYVRREQYYWTVDQLGLKRAIVHEFGRLNVENNVMSKRKIIELVKNKSVNNFDDPRLLTIRGLKRRGFTPDILQSIISNCSIERHDMTMSTDLLDHYLREYLDKNAYRVFAVCDPIKLTICDYGDNRECEHPNHPTDKSLGSHKTILSKNIYIENTDFRELDDKDYFRLAPNKTVRLRYADFIKYESHEIKDNNIIISAKNNTPDNPKKIKGIIHWLSDKGSVPARFELFNELYIDGKYNPSSKTVKNGYVESYVMDNLDKMFQFERIGFFKFDRYEDDIPVFIRIVGLVDKYNKK